MKLTIAKTIKGLSQENLIQLVSFIDDEDIDFVTEMNYSVEELLEKAETFFSKKDDSTLKIVSKDLQQANEKLHALIFTKKDTSSSDNKRSSNTSKTTDSLTPNQTLVINKIRKMIEKSATGKIRTDSIEIKDKSKFFLGGVLTTLVEKKLIFIEIEDKKKYVKLVQSA